MITKLSSLVCDTAPELRQMIALKYKPNCASFLTTTQVPFPPAPLHPLTTQRPTLICILVHHLPCLLLLRISPTSLPVPLALAGSWVSFLIQLFLPSRISSLHPLILCHLHFSSPVSSV
jgi:hypothetical protein